jgi:hypothetical protein
MQLNAVVMHGTMTLEFEALSRGLYSGQLAQLRCVYYTQNLIEKKFKPTNVIINQAFSSIY